MRREPATASEEQLPTQRPPTPSARAIVALVGNPNTGKTSLFNALTGFRRHVANYPGVTVDIAHGRVRNVDATIELVDLPGTYSLAAHSPDEMIVSEALCGRLDRRDRPDAVLAIVDAANPQRNFYLLSQLLDIGLPVVVALNMIDVAEEKGLHIDADELSNRLGVPVVPVVATRDATVRPLAQELAAAIGREPPRPVVDLPPVIDQQRGWLREHANITLCPGEALRVLMDEGGCAEQHYLSRGGDPTLLEQARAAVRSAEPEPIPAEIRARYAWIHRVLDGVIERRVGTGKTWSARVDRILTHRVSGAVALLAVLYAMFYAIYSVAGYPMAWVESGFGWVASLAGSILPDGSMIQSLVQDGLIAGVGGVLVFLPQILLLFFFIAILEDCGYLSRAAFMVDRLMRPLGLSGRAFIPLLSSFACAVPAIMGTRAIADRRERFITILIAPFMSCSARLPVYVLLIGAFVPAVSWLGGWVRLDALVMLGMYLVGVACAIPIALLLKHTVFQGPASSFLLELPSYKVPRLRTIWQRMYLAGRSFVTRAGTVILVVNVVVWALGYFPRSEATRAAVVAEKHAHGWDEDKFESELAGAYLRNSYLGRVGHAIEPAIKPLGWDWRVGVGVVASFPAREVIIATLGTVLNLGEADEGSTSLQTALHQMKWEDTDQPVFTLPVALSVMVFFALCAQCGATLATIGRETKSWHWPVISFVGMTTLAYFAAWGVSAGGRAIGL